MKAVKGARPIALTFDDGYLDFYTTAWPILQEFGFSATVFVVTDAIGRMAKWAGATAAPLMSWGNLSRLAETCVEIGAHGATHRLLDAALPDEIRHDLATAYQALSRRLGREPAGVAYPYGRWSPQVAAAAEAVGFRYGCTARGGINSPRTPLFKLRRTLIQCGAGLLRFACQVWTGYADWIDWRMDVRQIP
jgi:peptidoglycan/xylan/chitin deacetylase (PgdA/CDA1 family)